MKLIGLIRLGRDAEIRFANDGTPVATLAGAWNYGRKDADGKRPTQWADLSLWGDRAEKLAPFLTKGAQLLVHADDVHIETYQGRNGEGHKLVGRVDPVEFAGSREQSGGQQQPQQQRQAAPAAPQQRRPAPAPAPAQRSAGASGFDDMDDDIPF